MKNIKDITISIFAIIGFVAIVSGFTNNENQGDIGTYQVAITNVADSGNIREIIIDTRTGKVISRTRTRYKR
jgi:predicted small secreted protein